MSDEPIVWRAVGDDIEDDAVAEWQGLTLRAEVMVKSGRWRFVWWAVWKRQCPGGAMEVASCYDEPEMMPRTMAQAKAQAEETARWWAKSRGGGSGPDAPGKE